MDWQAEISYLTLAEALQNIFVRQRTGVLRVRLDEREERFVVLGGELYLSGSNPGRERLSRILLEPPAAEEDPRFSARAYLDRELRELVRELGDRLSSWRIAELCLTPQLGEVGDDVVGPVPTADLVMDLYARGWSLEELLRRLGGGAARFRAAEDVNLRLRVPRLDAEEVALLGRLDAPTSVASLLGGGEDAMGVACRLVRLRAVGLVETAAPAEGAGARPSSEVMGRIAERIREALETEPLELDPGQHRRRLSKLLQRYSQLGYFDLLGVAGDATPEEIHSAFMERARLAHPVHAERLGLTKSRRQLEWLLARLTEAYLVLSDPARAAEYRRGAARVPPPRPSAPDERLRRSERERLAKDFYREALDHVESEDFHYAIEMLRQAVLHAPRPEYYLLLGRCQMQNRKWLHMAVDSFRTGLTLKPDDTTLRQELAEATTLYREYQESLAEREASETAPESPEERRARRLLSKLRGERD